VSGFKNSQKERPEEKEEDIHLRVNQAKDIVSNARKRIKRMELTEEEFFLDESERKVGKAENKHLEVCLLASEMRNATRNLGWQVNHLASLTEQLLNAGYYRRNPYPHPWRLNKTFYSN
jgi:hypothetical protein